MELCGQAVVEQDPERLMELVSEILELLEAKERRLGILRRPGLNQPQLSSHIDLPETLRMDGPEKNRSVR
jgi:hypothetical protein